jgi:SAM-dependent methyltransferase
MIEKKSAPAALRNREPIADVLAEELPSSGTVLEIASGTGEHAMFLAQRFPHLEWQPTDPDPEALASIEAWRGEADLPNLRAPAALDAASPEWPIEGADAMLCINMIHISPWEASKGLFAGAARLLPQGGKLLLYGRRRDGAVQSRLRRLAEGARSALRSQEYCRCRYARGAKRAVPLTPRRNAGQQPYVGLFKALIFLSVVDDFVASLTD